MTSVRPRSRELAERASNGTQLRLLWRQGTRQLGFACWLQLDFERATEECAVALRMFRELGDVEGIAWSLLSLGTVNTAPASYWASAASRSPSLTARDTSSTRRPPFPAEYERARSGVRARWHACKSRGSAWWVGCQGLGSQWWPCVVRYGRGVRPRKAASRSLGPAVAGTVTGAAKRGCRPVRGTSVGAITSRLVARARGIGWRFPHARDMSHPWTATSRVALVAGAGPGIEQLAAAIAERPGGVSRQVAVLGCGVQANASGFDALTDRGQGFAGVPEQHLQVPAPARCRARQQFRRDGQDRAESVADRRFKQPGAFSRPCRRGCLGHRPGTGAAAAGAACGRPKGRNRPGSLNEVTRATRDAAMVSTHIECARYTPSWSRR